MPIATHSPLSRSIGSRLVPGLPGSIAALALLAAARWRAKRLIGRPRTALRRESLPDPAPALLDDGVRVGGEAWDLGTGVAAYRWDAPHPRAVLLLQHGYGEYVERFLDRYDRLIPRLLAIGVSVRAFDAWGHGRSPGRRGVTDLRRTVQDHLAARRLMAETGLPIFLLGHSMGGLVTAASVESEADRVAGVVLSSPALRTTVPRAVVAALGVAAGLAPEVALPFGAPPLDQLYAGAEQDEALLQDGMLFRGGFPLLLAATGAKLMWRSWSRNAAWRAPVLLLQGTEDRPEVARQFIREIGADDKTLHLVEGGRHELLNDTAASVTSAALLAWLSSRIPKDHDA